MKLNNMEKNNLKWSKIFWLINVLETYDVDIIRSMMRANDQDLIAGNSMYKYTYLFRYHNYS